MKSAFFVLPILYRLHSKYKIIGFLYENCRVFVGSCKLPSYNFALLRIIKTYYYEKSKEFGINPVRKRNEKH